MSSSCDAPTLTLAVILSNRLAHHVDPFQSPHHTCFFPSPRALSPILYARPTLPEAPIATTSTYHAGMYATNQQVTFDAQIPTGSIPLPYSRNGTLALLRHHYMMGLRLVLYVYMSIFTVLPVLHHIAVLIVCHSPLAPIPTLSHSILCFYSGY